MGLSPEIIQMFSSPGRRVLMGRPAGLSIPRVVVSREVVDVTPDQAMEWIAFAWTKYGSGRNFYPTDLAKIRRYAAQMTSGEWKWSLDQEAINLDDGLITNGRHRLHAILLAHETVPCTVVHKKLGADPMATAQGDLNGSSNSSE